MNAAELIEQLAFWIKMHGNLPVVNSENRREVRSRSKHHNDIQWMNENNEPCEGDENPIFTIHSN